VSERPWQRIAAISGAIFVICNVIGAITQGAPPSSNGDRNEFVTFFADHTNGIAAQHWLAGLSIIFLLAFASALWKRMADTPEGAPLAMLSAAGLLFGVVMLVAGTGVLAATALRIDEVGDTSRFYYFLAGTLIATGGFGVGAHLIANGAHAMRSGLLPRWLATMGLGVGALYTVAAVLGTATDEDGAYFLGFLAFLLWSIWVLITSTLLWRGRLAPAR
jgi:hypothetical protein